MIKLQKDTNFSDPRQRFVWALTQMMFNGMPFVAPSQVLEEWSEHLSACGFIHVSELEGLLDESQLPNRQSIHFQPPVRGGQHPFNTSGQWVPVDQPIQEPHVPAVAKMTPSEKAQLIAELRAEGSID